MRNADYPLRRISIRVLPHLGTTVLDVKIARSSKCQATYLSESDLRQDRVSILGTTMAGLSGAQSTIATLFEGPWFSCSRESTCHTLRGRNDNFRLVLCHCHSLTTFLPAMSGDLSCYSCLEGVPISFWFTKDDSAIPHHIVESCL